MDSVTFYFLPSLTLYPPWKGAQSIFFKWTLYSCCIGLLWNMFFPHPIDTGCHCLSKVHVSVFVCMLYRRSLEPEQQRWAFENRDLRTCCSLPQHCYWCSYYLMCKRSPQWKGFVFKLYTKACLLVHYARRTPKKTCANTQSWYFVFYFIQGRFSEYKYPLSAPSCVHIYTVTDIQYLWTKATVSHRAALRVEYLAQGHLCSIC